MLMATVAFPPAVSALGASNGVNVPSAPRRKAWIKKKPEEGDHSSQYPAVAPTSLIHCGEVEKMLSGASNVLNVPSEARRKPCCNESTSTYGPVISPPSLTP